MEQIIERRAKQNVRKIELEEVKVIIKTTRTDDGFYCENCCCHHLKSPLQNCNHKTSEGNCPLVTCQEISEREWLSDEELKKVLELKRK